MLLCLNLQGQSNYDRAMELAKNREFEKAFDLIYDCAYDGYSECYRPLGKMYALGAGTDKDFKKGKYWLKKAGFHMCYKCWGDGWNECDVCEGSGRRYSWSGSDIGKCLENGCSRGGINCYVCDGIGVYDPDE